MIPQVQIPDFVGTLQRQQALAQQGEMSRLQMLALQQAQDDAQKYRAVSAEVLPQLGTAQGDARMSLLARLAGSGVRGAEMALPMMQQDRERANSLALVRAIIPGFSMPGTDAPAAVPASMPVPALPQGAPVDGPSDPRARVQEAARRREAILSDASLTPQQQAAKLAEVSAWLAQPSVPERPGGYRANPGAPEAGQPFAGLPAPSGVVPAVLPGAARPAATPAVARPSAAPPPAMPAGAPSQAGLPTPQQIMALTMSGDPTAMRIAQGLAPLVARENPNWVSVTADGQVMMINPQNPAQRVVIGRSGNSEARPDWAQQTVLALGPRVASGEAAPEERQQYAVAATAWQNGGQQLATIPVDPNNPAAGSVQVAVPRALPPGFPAPPALQAGAPQAPAQPSPAPSAPTQQAQPAPGGVPIGQTGMTATPPDPNAPRVIGAVRSAPPAGFQFSQRDPTRLEPIPGGPQDPATQSLTEAQAKANLFGAQMQMGHNTLGTLSVPNSAVLAAWRNAPESVVNMALSQNDQQYFNALRLFAAGVLRKETGAAFTNSELLDVQSRFFPMPGDSAATIEQKRRARELALSSIRSELPGGQLRGAPQDGGTQAPRPDPLGLLGSRS